MRIAIVADIHGNLSALEAVARDLRETSPDLIVHGGDLVTHGYRPAEVIDLVRAMGWPGIVGNTDEMLWRPDRQARLEANTPHLAPLFRILFGSLAPATKDRIGADRLAYLQSLQMQWTNDDITLVHATPASLWRSIQPDAPDVELIETYAPLGSRMAVYCHIHKPYIRQLNGLTVCNTGSVGMSFDGDQRASYLLVENGRPSTRRVEYDVKTEIRDLQGSDYPHAAWLAEILRTATFIPPPAA